MDDLLRDLSVGSQNKHTCPLLVPLWESEDEEIAYVSAVNRRNLVEDIR